MAQHMTRCARPRNHCQRKGRRAACRDVLVIRATLAIVAMVALVVMATDNRQALQDCQLTHSFDTCASALR